MRTFLVFVLVFVMADSAGQSPGERDSGRVWHSACSFPDIKEREGAVRAYEGRYRGGFEVSSFALKEGNCELWLTGDICPIFTEGRCDKGATVTADVRVEGVLSQSRQRGFGHRGAYERQLTVTRVLAVTRLQGDDH